MVASDISWKGGAIQLLLGRSQVLAGKEPHPIRLPRKVQGLNGMNTRGRQKSTRTNFDRIVEHAAWQLYLSLFLLEWPIPDKSNVRKYGFMAHGEDAVHARMRSTQQRACGSRSIGGCMHFLSSQEAEGTEC